jgi:hypothetical protein
MSYELDLSILKTLISDKKNALEFIHECDTKIFTSEYWNFANLVVSYLRTYKEIPTLRVIEEKLSRGNNTHLLEMFGKLGPSWTPCPSQTTSIKYQLEKIKKRFAEKQLTGLKETLSKQEPGAMDVDKSLADIQKTVQSIRGVSETKTYERKTLKNAIASFPKNSTPKEPIPK